MAVGLGVVTGSIGLALLVFGYTALGVIVLGISVSLTLGILTPRQRSSRSGSVGRGTFYGGAAGSTGGYDNGNDGGGGFDGGGGGGEVREVLHGVTAWG